MIPAFTQIRGKYKNYFFVIAIAGLLGEIAVWLYLLMDINIRWIINYSYIFVSILLPFCIVELKDIRNWKYWLFISLSFGILFCLIPHSKHAEIIVLFIIHFLTAGLFIRTIFQEAINLAEINLFTLLLFTYQLTNTVRFFYGVAGTNIGLENDVFLTKFAIFLGLFFVISKERNKYLIFRIKD